MRLPVLIENSLNLLHRLRIADAQTGLLDLFQRAPVKILATDKSLFAIHQQILGVNNTAGQPMERNHPQLQVGDSFQGRQRFRR